MKRKWGNKILLLNKNKTENKYSLENNIIYIRERERLDYLCILIAYLR